jgi:tetratricopeptide (TPR) repeat protein
MPEAIEAVRTSLKLNPDLDVAQNNLGAWLVGTSQYEEAEIELKKIKEINKDNIECLLKCYLYQNKIYEFYELAETITKSGRISALLGSLINRAEIRYEKKINNPYCSRPMDYLFEKNIIKDYDFKNIFIKPITEIANIEVILNRENGHGMKGKGNGTLLFRINTLGKFEMFGDFSVVSGSYSFKYGGLIGKKFDVKKGGSIIWTGDPLAAQLNLEAVYKTTANPAVLIDNPSFNRKVDVEVVIGVRGNLTNPEPDFNINFPNVGSSLKSEIQYKLDDKDARQTQALYLLSTGSFLSQEGVNQNQLSNNLFEKASSLFSDIFSGDNDKISIAPEYIVADRTLGQQTDGRFGVTVSSKINDRITVNGKVGVPVGGITETAIVGNLEVQYHVNRDGTLNLRVFNKENDITYIGQGIGYTQGLGMSYEVDFDTFKELVNKIFKNAKLEKVSTNLNQIQDSNLYPDDIQIKDKKNKKQPNIKPNQEAIPTDD